MPTLTYTLKGVHGVRPGDFDSGSNDVAHALQGAYYRVPESGPYTSEWHDIAPYSFRSAMILADKYVN